MFGVGLNNFGNQFAVLDHTGLSRLTGLFDRSNHVVHNLHLLILTEVGMVGYAAFALVFGIGILRGFLAVRQAATGDPLAAIASACAIGLIAHLLHGLVDPGFRLNLGIAELLYTGLGMIAAVRAVQVRLSSPRTRGEDAGHRVVSGVSPKGEGEGMRPGEPRPAPSPHRRLPPRLAPGKGGSALSPRAGIGDARDGSGSRQERGFR